MTVVQHRVQVSRVLPASPADRISDETVTVTFREVEPGRTDITLVNTWTGPAAGPSDYETLREGWNVWLDMLEKSDAV